VSVDFNSPGFDEDMDKDFELIESEETYKIEENKLVKLLQNKAIKILKKDAMPYKNSSKIVENLMTERARGDLNLPLEPLNTRKIVRFHKFLHE
jgi:hypothetical protein